MQRYMCVKPQIQILFAKIAKIIIVVTIEFHLMFTLAYF